MRKKSKIFQKQHNESQKWKNRKKRLDELPIRRIPENFEIDVNKLPITEGKVHFIRKVKKDDKISVLNEDFDVDESLAYEYVWTTLDTKEEKLMIYHREEKADEARLVKVHEYRIDEEVKPFDVGF